MYMYNYVYVCVQRVFLGMCGGCQKFASRLQRTLRQGTGTITNKDTMVRVKNMSLARAFIQPAETQDANARPCKEGGHSENGWERPPR